MKGITIIGGGLAGLSLALGLRRRQIPVSVHEAGHYPRHRVCGEFISGVQPDTLEVLGLTEVFRSVPRQRRVRWVQQGREMLTAELPEPAYCVSRYWLDDQLQQAVIAAGGEVISSSRQSRQAIEGQVWAAGRIPTKSEWLGLKCHVQGFPMEAELEMHLGPRGYLGLVPIEEERVNLCGLFQLDRERSGRGSERLFDYLRQDGHHSLVERLEAARIDEDSFSGVAGFRLGEQAVEPGLCAIGDAWGMIPPFTGNGMSMAFESAELALQPLTAWASSGLSWPDAVRHIRQGGQRRFRRRLRSARLLHRLLLHPTGQRTLSHLAQRGCLPFQTVLSLVR